MKPQRPIKSQRSLGSSNNFTPKKHDENEEPYLLTKEEPVMTRILITVLVY